MRLPFIVKMPEGKNSGWVTDAMVTWADLTPTILDMAGVLEEMKKKIRLFQEETGDPWIIKWTHE